MVSVTADNTVTGSIGSVWKRVDFSVLNMTLANFLFGSFYSVSSTLAVARGGEKPWNGQPGDFQGHWRTVEAAFRGGEG